MRGKARVRVFNLYLYEAETEAGKINTKRSNDSLVLKKERHADSLHGVTFLVMVSPSYERTTFTVSSPMRSRYTPGAGKATSVAVPLYTKAPVAV